MKLFFSSLVVVLCILLALPANLFAQLYPVKYRGFGLGYASLTESQIIALNSVHGTNLARFQFTSTDLESITEAGGEAAYIAFAEEILDQIDLRIDATQDSTYPQMILFSMALSPGGFDPNSVGEAHLKMFSNATFQEWYLNMLVRIRDRYASYIANGNFIFDIHSEPNDDSREPNNGALDWNELLIEAIRRIRSAEDSLHDGVRAPIVGKALFASPDNLKRLPCVNDDNFYFGYHGYIHNEYQHSCQDGRECGLERPSGKSIKAKIVNNVARLMRTQFNKCDRAPEDVDIVVPEFGVSACAEERHLYTQNLLEVMEGDDVSSTGILKKKKKKKNKKKKNKKKTKKGKGNSGLAQYRGLVANSHYAYANHAFAEAQVWDPRYICDSNNDPEFSGDDTDMFDTLRTFFARNDTNP